MGDNYMLEKKSFHIMEPGEDLGFLEIDITAELNQQYLYAEEDYHLRYIEKSEFGQPIAHPGLLLNMSNNTKSPSYYIDPRFAGLHIQEEVEFINPVEVGKKIRITWNLVDSFYKRERICKVIGAKIEDEAGKEIINRKSTVTFASKI